MKPIIHININFTQGGELSYYEGLEAMKKKESFVTNCLDFFNFDHVDEYDIHVIKREAKEKIMPNINSFNPAIKHCLHFELMEKISRGAEFKYISLTELLEAKESLHVMGKEIRRTHNARKMLVCDGFIWQDLKLNVYDTEGTYKC